MISILNENEQGFLNVTNEILQDYLDSEYISDRLILCTKRQINKKNFLSKFDDFKKCIHKKMVILANPIERSFDAGKILPHQEIDITIPEVIEKSKIIKAMLKGDKFLKIEFEKISDKNKDLKKEEDTREIFFLIILNIIGKANLEFKFNKKTESIV